MIRDISAQAGGLLGLTTRKHASKTKLITFTSGKGGVGKSTFTANMSYLMAKKGLKICVLDADIGLANLQVLFNVKPEFTFFDYVDGKCKLSQTLCETPYENITLIAGKSGYKYANKTNSYVFTRIVNDILNLEVYDILLVDTGAGLNEYVQEFLDISEHIFAITSTDPSALTDVYALIKMLSELDKQKVMLCFNHTKSFQIGAVITNSLIELAKKNKISDKFMIKYLGNVSTSDNISTIARMRKLFAKEFVDDSCTRELTLVVNGILQSIKQG